MFIHTTESIQSAYYILEKEMDEESGVMIYSVESDVGNPYVYFFDLEIFKRFKLIIQIKKYLTLYNFDLKAW